MLFRSLGSTNSGATAPATTYANQLWYDTANNILKIRNEDNDAWIALLTLDQVADAVSTIGSISLSSISDVIANAITLTGTQTLTNKTLTNPVINGFTGNTAVVNIGSGQFYKDTSGNIGINTTSPLAKLHTKLATDKNILFDASGSGGASRITVINDAGNANVDFQIQASNILFNSGGTEVAKFVTNGNFQFNSGYGSVATVYGCRAWVNFNGQGTVSIRGSGNVSSITDNGTGSYTVNFTNALPDTNYSVSGFANNISPYDYPTCIGYNRNVSKTTGQVGVYVGFTGSQASLGGVIDSDSVDVVIFR